SLPESSLIAPVAAEALVPDVSSGAGLPAGVPPLPANKPAHFKPLIVIDPGHGGDDPGAIASGGLFEKDITLAAGRELAQMLRATGRYEVRLTRDGDDFLSLGERIAFARRAGADLFISVHCDALDDTRVRGATIYTVSETASDEEARRAAAKENESDANAGIELIAASYDEQTTDILIDLTRRDTMNASARFAMIMGREVGQVATLRRNSHRFAGFKVLKAPDVPSVLFEMGYLSNPKDLAMLASRAGRKTLLGAVVTAADRYFEQVTASQEP
ncbi:MAG: N-acetylmuramoyl-L-alanine amidase family protein, partial [Alphaproteobacteria bacterium]